MINYTKIQNNFIKELNRGIKFYYLEVGFNIYASIDSKIIYSFPKEKFFLDYERFGIKEENILKILAYDYTIPITDSKEEIDLKELTGRLFLTPDNKKIYLNPKNIKTLGKDYELFWALGTPIIVAKKDNVILSLFSMIRVEDSVTSTNFR